MCNELSNVYVILLCPILRHHAMCPPRYIYNCVGLYRHTQVYIYIIYNNNIYFYALLYGHRYKYIYAYAHGARA